MSKKNFHENFLRYTKFITSHPNYEGLPFKLKKDGTVSWVTTKNSDIGKGRLKWAEEKAKKLNFDLSKPYLSKVMYEIHPTKNTVCQICGEKMSIKYIYPNANFIKYLIKSFDYEPNIFDTIYDINNHFLEMKKTESEIKVIYIKRLKLDKKYYELSLDELSVKIEYICRSGKKNAFGPGAMSNFPDRYDGFHSYNRCCRSKEDKGRSKENLKSYTKDRRAYEYWSDGNIHAANKYMGSGRFEGLSADHIGPISLGFIHDPRFLQPMISGENSSKNNRLDISDLNKLINLENTYNISPVSWFAKNIWKEIKIQSQCPSFVISDARMCLQENMFLFMEILWNILENTEELGENFLEQKLLVIKKHYFEYDYEFDLNGNITKYYNRNITDSTRKEYGRFVRICFNSVYEFHEKENRNLKVAISENNLIELNNLLTTIKKGPEFFDIAFELLENLIENIQNQLIERYLKK